MLNYPLNALRGVSPPPLWLPRCNAYRAGAISLSLNAGAAWGEGSCPLLPLYQHPEFHIHGKEILPGQSHQRIRPVEPEFTGERNIYSLKNRFFRNRREN